MSPPSFSPPKRIPKINPHKNTYYENLAVFYQMSIYKSIFNYQMSFINSIILLFKGLLCEAWRLQQHMIRQHKSLLSIHPHYQHVNGGQETVCFNVKDVNKK